MKVTPEAQAADCEKSSVSSDFVQPAIFGDNHYVSHPFCLRRKKNNESTAKPIFLLPLYKDYSIAHMTLSTGDIVISWAKHKGG